MFVVYKTGVNCYVNGTDRWWKILQNMQLRDGEKWKEAPSRPPFASLRSHCSPSDVPIRWRQWKKGREREGERWGVGVLPTSGTAIDVDGTISATISWNTLSDRRIVIPANTQARQSSIRCRRSASSTRHSTASGLARRASVWPTYFPGTKLTTTHDLKTTLWIHCSHRCLWHYRQHKLSCTCPRHLAVELGFQYQFDWNILI